MNLILGLVVIACVCSNGYAWSPEGELKWWQTGIIYQIYPRSFRDSGNDGVGDLKGITSKLEHLKDIGVIAVWLSPIYPSPQVDAGYDISDFKNIHYEYGTLEDFEALQKKAKDLGLKVVLDLVPNHSSDKHPWFVASESGDPKYKDYYIWRDGKNGKGPNNWLSNFRGPAWQWSDKRKQYYYHAFAVQQPDLNYENPAVVDEMKDVIRFWLKRGVDGFRVDAVPFLFEDKNLKDEQRSYTTNDSLDFNYLIHDLTQNQDKTYDMVKQWRAVLEEFGPDKIMMAEVYAPFDKTMEYFGTKERPGAHFPFNFFPISELNRTSGPQQWKEIIDRWMTAMTGIRWPNWVMGNHDNRRIAGRFGSDMADGINMISLTLPGTAMTYNGEEICMDDTFIPWSRVQDPVSKNNRARYTEVGRDPERSPMQWDDTTSAGFSKNASTWLPVNPNYWKVNVAAQKSADRSPLKMYKDIVEARKQDTLKRGDYKTLVDGNVLIIVRTLKDKPTFVTAVNLGDEDAEFTVKDIPDVFVWTTSMNAGNIAKSSKVIWPLRLRPKAGVLLSELKNAATRLSFGMAAAVAAVFAAYILGRRY